MSDRELRELLAEARAALGPEFCGPPNSLAGRIDEMLHPVDTRPQKRMPGPVVSSMLVVPDLVIESYGDGFAWFRR